MLEVLIPAGVAISTGLSIIFSKLYSRINELDSRLDGVELRIASDYLSKAEFSTALERVEAHMIRIENKLDNLVK